MFWILNSDLCCVCENLAKRRKSSPLSDTTGMVLSILRPKMWKCLPARSAEIFVPKNSTITETPVVFLSQRSARPYGQTAQRKQHIRRVLVTVSKQSQQKKSIFQFSKHQKLKTLDQDFGLFGQNNESLEQGVRGHDVTFVSSNWDNCYPNLLNQAARNRTKSGVR